MSKPAVNHSSIFLSIPFIISQIHSPHNNVYISIFFSLRKYWRILLETLSTYKCIVRCVDLVHLLDIVSLFICLSCGFQWGICAWTPNRWSVAIVLLTCVPHTAPPRMSNTPLCVVKTLWWPPDGTFCTLNVQVPDTVILFFSSLCFYSQTSLTELRSSCFPCIYF